MRQLILSLLCLAALVTDVKPTKAQQVITNQSRGIPYYHFGIVAYPSHKADSVYKRYGISVINRGCMADVHLLAINERTDSLVQRRYGKRMEVVLGEWR